MEILRMCVVCRQMKDKRGLLRIVKDKEGNIFVDITGKKNGRGAYICKDLNCLAKLKKQKVLNKVFKTNINEEVYKQIEEDIIGQN